MDDKLFDLMTKMYTEVQGIKAEIQQIGNRMDNVETEVRTLGNNITVLENTVDEKLSALFDGYKQNTDKVERVSDDVAEIKEEVFTIENLTLSNRSDIIKLKRVK